MEINNTVKWLLRGDVSIQFQVYRDLLSMEKKDLQERISREGWGLKYLKDRDSDGHWGLKFYQPKWTSSHYSLLDLRNLCISPDQPEIQESVDMILTNEKGPDGGINPAGTISQSDVCINGMFLNYASYFRADEDKLKSVVDFILKQVVPDGGFNCRYNRSGAKHSSMHSTLSVMEGITEYQKNSYSYRIKDLLSVRESSKEFLLLHNLYLSDRSGKIIDHKFLRFPYPTRWRYDILKAMDYFQYAGDAWDERMSYAMELMLKKKDKEGRWPLNAKYPGKEHFSMEDAGKQSRWNSLRALRVIKYYS